MKQAPLAQVHRLLEEVGLSEAAGRKVKTYSKGMRQRLGLAQALLGQPRLLLLDEPTVGLDPVATQALYRLTDALRQQGTSIILCSHVLPGVERHIDRVAILSAGRLQALGTIDSLRRHAALPVHIRATGVSDGSTREVSVRPDQKADALRDVLANPAVQDVSLQEPSLEDLYCYYMTQAATAPEHRS